MCICMLISVRMALQVRDLGWKYQCALLPESRGCKPFQDGRNWSLCLPGVCAPSPQGCRSVQMSSRCGPSGALIRLELVFAERRSLKTDASGGVKRAQAHILLLLELKLLLPVSCRSVAVTSCRDQ